ncbi:hypothetical protein TWF718_003994 [Orbilia javanica]|uniref:Mitochondrial division protein 1 n=1 Tax=Orbilia javanica TaxID=47235 RepID=A0AAN8MRP3_9PEZI
MATVKNRGVFRAQGISLETTLEEFKAALENLLTTEERRMFTLAHLQLVPACNGSRTQAAIFKYQPGPPPFVSQPMFQLQGNDVVIDSEFYGLTQLYAVKPGDIKIDIVAISGLNSHAIGSWTNPETDRMWLRDFISKDEDLNHCRVMVFGYDTKYQSKKEVWIEDHAKCFLIELDKARVTEKEKNRPLVVIGHSFGGTILTHAYVQAVDSPELRHIHDSITDILFFGVPFRGINFDDVRSMVGEISDLAGQGERLVEYIDYETIRQTSTVTRFKGFIQGNGTRIFSFFETQKTPRVVKQEDGGYSRTGTPSIVVNKNSVEVGIYGLERLFPAEGDHSTLVKLKSNQEPTYTTIRNYLKKTIQAEGTVQRKRIRLNDQDINKHNSNWDSELCIRELRTTDPRDDKERIQETKGGLLKDSYKWVTENPDFQRWRNDDKYRMLWVSGDPGKGKTMLLCGIVDELEETATSTHGSLYLSYFFCQATDSRINSATAVLRGLIFLLVAQEQSLISHIQKKHNQAGKGLFEDTNSWSALSKILTDILRDITKEPANKLYLVIDALDECVTGQEQLLSFISQHVSTWPQIKWVVSSRNWPSIERDLGLQTDTGSRLSLELNAALVSRAVEIYVAYKVSELWPGEGNETFKKQICEQLLEKANGTFLWVALVLKDLRALRGTYQGQDRKKIMEKLGKMPNSLPELYRHMIDQINGLPDENPRLCRIILAAVTVAYRPLRLVELPAVTELEGDPTNPGVLDVLVRNCGSFLTVRQGIIYFVHQSAKDFLIEEENSSIFTADSSLENIHYSMFSHSLQTMPKALRRNIYGLSNPGIRVGDIKTPDLDLLAQIGYSCAHWVGHLLAGRVGGSNFRENDEDYILGFLQQHFLHWLEAMSLMGALPESIKMINSFLSMFGVPTGRGGLRSFISDARRFILTHRTTIETQPLQLYSSCLLFSPSQSVVRTQNWNEVPEWMEGTPRIQEDWDSCLHILRGNTGNVNKICFSPDGKLLAAYSLNLRFENTIRLWDLATGSLRAELKDHHEGIRSIHFLSDNRLLSFSHNYRGVLPVVKFWNTNTGTLCSTIDGLHSSIADITGLYLDPMPPGLSPDSKFLAYFFNLPNTGVRVWDIHKNCLYADINAVDAGSISFSPDSKFLVLNSSPTTRLVSEPNCSCETTRLWDIATKAFNTKLCSGPRICTSLFCVRRRPISFSSDGKLLVDIRKCGFNLNNYIEIWDVATGDLQTSTEIPGTYIDESIDSDFTYNFSPDGKLIAFLSPREATIGLWDTATGALHTKLKYPRHNFKSGLGIARYSFSPNSELLALYCSDGNGIISLWIVNTGALYAEFKCPPDCRINSIAFSPDSRLLTSCYVLNGDNVIALWCAGTRSLRAQFKGNFSSIMSVSFSPDSTLLASLHSDCTIILWDTAAKVSESRSGNHAGLIPSPDNILRASLLSNSVIKIWDTIKKYLNLTPDTHVDLYSCDYAKPSPDGTLLALWSDYKSFPRHTIRILSTVTGGLRTEFSFEQEEHEGKVPFVAFSSDGKLLVSCSSSDPVGRNYFKIWNTATGALQAKLEGYAEGFSTALCEFSPDSALLASYHRFASIKIWNTATGVLQTTFDHHENASLLQVSFSPNSKSLASYCSHHVKLWDVASKSLKAQFKLKYCVVEFVALSPDNRFLASVHLLNASFVSGPRWVVELWDINTGGMNSRFNCSPNSFACFSPDSIFLALSCSSPSGDIIQLRDTTTGALEAEFESHVSPINSLIFSPDGKLLLSVSSNNGTIGFWGVSTGPRSQNKWEHLREQGTLIVPPNYEIYNVRFQNESLTIILRYLGNYFHFRL